MSGNMSVVLYLFIHSASRLDDAPEELVRFAARCDMQNTHRRVVWQIMTNALCCAVPYKGRPAGDRCARH